MNRKLTALFAESPTQIFVAEQSQHIIRHFLDIADIAQVTAFAVVDDFGDSAYASCNDGQFAGLSFESGEAE